MMILVPKEESDFREKVKRLIMDFAMAEGINFESVDDSKTIASCSSSLAYKLWWIKNNVHQSDFDKMNTREEREKMEKEMAEAKSKGMITYSCQCGFFTNREDEFDNHNCEFRKKQRRAINDSGMNDIG